MFYTTETGRQHATTYFNRTIDIVEPHTWVDFQGIFLFVLILAAVGGLGTFLPPFLPLSYFMALFVEIQILADSPFQPYICSHWQPRYLFLHPCLMFSYEVSHSQHADLTAVLGKVAPVSVVVSGLGCYPVGLHCMVSRSRDMLKNCCIEPRTHLLA